MYYTVAAETGSRSIDSDDLYGHRWESKGTCGHKHKTREAAQECLEKLTRTKNGQSSAYWWKARIHDQDGHRV